MGYSISQVADKLDLTAYTLRYYDKEGLLPFVDRDTSGFRKFKDADIEWLEIIGCLKASGMPIKEIKAFVDWHVVGDSTLQERHDLFLERKKTVLAQIEELHKILDKLNFQCWYYEKALEAGTLEVHKEKPGYTPPIYNAEDNRA